MSEPFPKIADGAVSTLRSGGVRGAEGGTRLRTGVVLIGASETVRTLHAQMVAAGVRIIPTGAILLRPPLKLAGAGAGTESPEAAPGLPLLGSLADLEGLHARYRFQMAVVSLPAAARSEFDRCRSLLERLRIPVRVVAPLAELLSEEPLNTIETAEESPPVPGRRGAGGATWLTPTPVDLADLIGREPYALDRQAVGAILTGKRVLITGAGGSIGSHLAQVAAEFGPEQVVLMDRSENALFEIDRQLGRRFPGIGRRAILHDVVDADQTLRHLVAFRPAVVFHAAAHKHVPLMEDHPAQALTNNLFGTKSIADAAVATGVERFVMISSDKAVNPSSVMGATKRLAERYVQSLAHSPGAIATRMSMVRFGNVLGSACSVLTIWASQIAEGGPLTVTEPRMSRYFMTIPEAATLVIQAAALGEARTGAVYVLDMGEPVRIVELAERFCRAHGLVPRIRDDSVAPMDNRAMARAGPSIDIVFSGVRPGEKLHEELAYPSETLRPTSHPGIRAWDGADLDKHDAGDTTAMIAELSGFRNSTDVGSVVAAIARHTPSNHRS